jgi:hypothetical protein
MVERSRAGKKTVLTIYAPLAWLSDNTPLGGPPDWYIQQWLKLVR